MRTLEPPETLVDMLLAEQRTLTAVEKFSQLQQRHEGPLLAPHYRDLIPLSAPRPGEQYAFEVDLDKCSGCKACVSACHSLNGLDDGETWREVGALFGERLVPKPEGGNRVVPIQQTVTTACHHCVDPACLEGCPVLAYDKDPVTGIVRHLGDQCIGCSYCVMKCPYEVPKFSAKRGIVRKCDMCHDRLAVGEAPACVQACPSEAIRITLTQKEAVRAEFSAKKKVWLPDSPQPDYTIPTTRYLSTKPDADLRSADHFTLRPAPAHWPLILMLVLTQAGIGGMVISSSNAGSRQRILSFALFIAGLVASAFHLGQPAKAWRVWLGWRTSWLSREAIALAAFGGIASVALAVHVATLLPATTGLIVLTTQTMVYADTRRHFWRLASTFPRFLGTAAMLGLALKLCFAPGTATAFALLFVTLSKLAADIAVLKHADSDDDHWTQLRRTAALQREQLRPALSARILLALAGGILIPFGVAVGAMPPGLAVLACALCFGGELVERYLFFTSVAPDKMPGHTVKARRANTFLRQWIGPLTTDLVRSPGEFGLGQVPARLKPDATTSMVCGFCSTGCGLKIHLRDGEAINLTPDPTHPVNFGMACPKGWEALTPLSASDRGTTPLLRDAHGKWRPVDWHAAMAEFCGRMKDVQARHGPHSIAFLSTGQICTEEMALLGCLFRFGMGGLHCDSNTRQCMATAHVAYKQSFGFDAPPFTYADFEESDVLVFVGANPCIAHPIMWQRVMRNPHHPEIIVVDPRATETAMAATQHYALRPKSDLTLLYGVANCLLEVGAVNRSFVDAHTTGFQEFASFVEQFTPERVCAESGLTREQLDRFVDTIAKGKRVSFWWTMGVNQGHEATRTAQAIINLALMTGNIGRPGTGANSITGQCNAMGSRLYSNITSLIGGHDFKNPAHRAKVSAMLGVAEERIPTEPNWAYDQIVEGIADGKIRALWVIATNGSHSWIHQNKFNNILAKLDFLVVQDMYPSTETAQRAHLFLPAAGWGEKEGTLINSERRIGLVKKVRRAPGLALADFHIFKLAAEYRGCGRMFEKWRNPEATFQLLKDLSRGQPCDITGIRDYRMIDECGGIQWPWAEDFSRDKPPVERRLFEDGCFFTQDQRAKFFFDAPRPLAEPTDAEFPFVLLTGRGTSAQWHTGSRTNKSDVLRALSPADCYVEINPKDAVRLGLEPNAPVRVRSRRASLVAVAFVTPTVQPGQIFIPMHYAEVNRLTHSSFDPHSRQPSYKHCAVALEKPEGKAGWNGGTTRA